MNAVKGNRILRPAPAELTRTKMAAIANRSRVGVRRGQTVCA